MRNDFKPGDDVWYFIFPEDGCGGFDISQIELKVDKNISKERLMQGYIDYCFKSKEDAIKAIIKKIESFK